MLIGEKIRKTLKKLNFTQNSFANENNLSQTRVSNAMRKEGSEAQKEIIKILVEKYGLKAEYFMPAIYESPIENKYIRLLEKRITELEEENIYCREIEKQLKQLIRSIEKLIIEKE